jgi:hypothetical protein
VSIPNVELRLSDVPDASADTQARDTFAQTLDGYSVWGDSIAEMANGALRRWESTGVLPLTLTELRCCAFYEQRRRNHVGEGIEEDQVEYENALYTAMRALLDRRIVDDEQATVSVWHAVNPGVGPGGASGHQGDDETPARAETDAAVARWLDDVASRLQAGPDLPLALREQHLSRALKDAINASRPGCATTKVLALDAWRSLGRSTTDGVVVDPDTGAPSVVFELKWCQQGHDKVHEAIWDLFKVALLVAEYHAEGYLVTAAPVDMWPTALCGELFSSGTFSSRDLFARTFPGGRPVWDWLLEGGYERYPEEVPDEVSLVEVARATVSLGSLAWEIRAVRVSPSAGRVRLMNGWPDGTRPAGATHPPTSTD